MRRAAGHLLDRPWVVVLALAAALVAWWAAGTRRQPHHVRAVFSSAVSLTSGLDVQVDGVDVGKVGDVAYRDGEAIVELGIDDERVWPLPRGTTAEIRFGTTVGNGTRTVQLHPGPRDAPAIPDGGVIARRDTRAPVELDRFFDTMDAPTRRRFQDAMGLSAAGTSGRGRELNAALRRGPGAVASLGGVLGDLAVDEGALASLIAGGDRASAVLAARAPGIEQLLQGAASTFDALSRDADGVRASIERLPATLRETRTTLARLDATVPRLDALLRDVAPGARRLRTLAPVAVPAAAELRRTSRLGASVLRAVAADAPGVTGLLRDAAPFLGRVGRAFEGTVPTARCVRPYAPEIAAFLSTWTGFSQNLDAGGHYARTHILQGPTSVNDQPLSSAQLVRVVPGVTYALPRPPGLNEGRPRSLPECGAGPDALDPAKDPEARR
jgi:virulence factor Mce-like protein